MGIIMAQIYHIACKDCHETFPFTEEAGEDSIRSGLTPPERCPSCRIKHRKEYRSLGVSHNKIPKIRNDGQGGLAIYKRKRQEPQVIELTRKEINPYPVDKIIGDSSTPGTLLHGLLTDYRRIHLVVAPTGSAKSTWLPFRLLCNEDIISRGKIVVTQPRIPATVGPAEYVAELYYNDKKCIGPGYVIGYRYSDIGQSMTDNANRMIFMTDGTLLNWIKNGQIRHYQLVMIDEAHERSVHIDKILALLKYKLSEFPHLQILIASATVDAQSFINFFGGEKHVAQYEAEGFNYPILEIFSNESIAYCPNIWENRNDREAYWRTIPEESNEYKDYMLGPAPCWVFKNLPDYKLRYYPQFESLVFVDIMDEDDEKTIKSFFDNKTWINAIAQLAQQSRKERKISDKKSIPINEMIRGVKKQENPLKPIKISQDVKDKLVYATIDKILEVIERDETEARNRLNRWENRKKYNWSELEKPMQVGHILAFLPTSQNIEKCYELLRIRLEEKGWHNNNLVLRFFRDAPEDEKKIATDKDDPNEDKIIRKIVIGSNLAETSLTLHGLIYIVDSGLICEEYFDPEQGKSLPTVPHSKAGCRQRIGRVGRKAPGEAYRLYTREELKSQPDYTTPQIARTNSEDVVLDLIRSGVPLNKVSDILMNSPAKSEIDRAKNELKRFGAIDEDEDLTHLGEELANSYGDSLLSKRLLSEADKFGVLWEMAIFLAFISLKETKAPPMKNKERKINYPNKWLGLWDPTNQILYDDMEEEEKQSRALKDNTSIWDNPYILGKTLIIREKIIDKCIDDLELYLRIWQGWYANKTEESRKEWADKHAVNHNALDKIESLLGLKPEDDQGAIRDFWAVDEKGAMSRDVNFNKLNLVRFLYAAGHPENIYKINDKNQSTFKKLTSPKEKPAIVHQESAWAYRFAVTDSDDPENDYMQYCVGSSRGYANHTFIRHIVSLKREWIEPEPPSFFMSAIQIAQKFSDEADKLHAATGSKPFLTRLEKAGINKDIPTIKVPSKDEIEQWKQDYKNGIQNGNEINAKVIHIIEYPYVCTKNIVLVKTDDNMILPVKADGYDMSKFNIEDPITININENQFILWGELRQKELYKKETTGPVEKTENIYTMPRGKATVPFIKIQVNAFVDAEVENVKITDKFRGFFANVTTEKFKDQKVQIFYNLPDQTIKQEAQKDRGVKLQITGHGTNMNFGNIIRWHDGKKVYSIKDIWPLETTLEAKVVKRHNKNPNLVLAEVSEGDGLSFRWAVKVSGKILKEIQTNRIMQVKVTRWNKGNGNPWPYLDFIKWIQ